MKRKRIMLIASCLLILGAGFFGTKIYFRSNPDVLELKTDRELSAAKLTGDFQADDSSATHNYLGKVLEVTGTLEAIEKDEKGFFTLVLSEPGQSAAVRCTVDFQHNKETISLKQGMKIKIKGICTGFNADVTGLLGSDVLLNRAAILPS